MFCKALTIVAAALMMTGCVARRQASSMSAAGDSATVRTEAAALFAADSMAVRSSIRFDTLEVTVVRRDSTLIHLRGTGLSSSSDTQSRQSRAEARTSADSTSVSTAVTGTVTGESVSHRDIFFAAVILAVCVAALSGFLRKSP